jgi:hypothetical protein
MVFAQSFLGLVSITCHKKNKKNARRADGRNIFLPQNRSRFRVHILTSRLILDKAGGHPRARGRLVRKAAALQTIGRIRETKKSQSGGGVGTLGPRGLTPWAVQCALQTGSGHLTLVEVVGHFPASTVAASHLFVMNGYLTSSPQKYLFPACVRVENVGKDYF